jgi:hypothetical protein
MNNVQMKWENGIHWYSGDGGLSWCDTREKAEKHRDLLNSPTVRIRDNAKDAYADSLIFGTGLWTSAAPKKYELRPATTEESSDVGAELLRHTRDAVIQNVRAQELKKYQHTSVSVQMRPGTVIDDPVDRQKEERARVIAWLQSMKPSEEPFKKGAWELERKAAMALWERMRAAVESGKEAPKGDTP